MVAAVTHCHPPKRDEKRNKCAQARVHGEGATGHRIRPGQTGPLILGVRGVVFPASLHTSGLIN
jgi:hypothetical protein